MQFLFALVAATVLGGWPNHCRAATVAINYNGISPNTGSGFANGVGVVFTVGSQNLQATALGATGWVSDWNNVTHTSTKLNNNPLTMKLWRVSDGALLGSVQLTSADYSQTWNPSPSNYNMPYLSEAFSAITLISGVQYQVALYNTSTTNFQYINGLDSAALKPAVSSAITFNQNRYASAGGFIMPATADTGTTVKYGGPTFEFNVRTNAVQWNSTSSGVWNTGTTANWLNTGSSTSDVFVGGDAVTFGDAPGLQTSITINATVQPTSVTVNSSTNNYSFGGTAGIGGASSLLKQGSSTLTLNNVNTYTGLTTVSDGTLAYGVDNAISTGGVTVNGASAVLNLGAFSDSIGTVTLAGGGQINSSTGVLTSTSGFTMHSGSASAILAGGVALTKSTGGTVTLSGANTYTGATTVDQGTLLINGSLTGAGGAVTVTSGGTLGGSGVINRAVNINTGGTLAPGNSPDQIFTGALTLAPLSNYDIEIYGATVGNGVTGYDQTVVTGAVSLNGALLNLLTVSGVSVGDTFTIIDNDGVDAVVGTFAGLGEGAEFSKGGYYFNITYAGGVNSNDVVLEITALVPEPGSLTLCGLALLGGGWFAGRHRKRRRDASFPNSQAAV